MNLLQHFREVWRELFGPSLMRQAIDRRFAQLRRYEDILRRVYATHVWMDVFGLDEVDMEPLILEVAAEMRDFHYTTEEVARIMKVRSEQLVVEKIGRIS